MALSLFSAQTNFPELPTVFDPSRFGFDFAIAAEDQMEYSTAVNHLQNSANYRNYIDEQHANNLSNRINSNFQNYNQVGSFIDSPPNTKDSWPEEQVGEVPTIIDVQTIYSTNTNRKRRMDWELDISQSGGDTNGSTPAKVASNNMVINENKERDKKKLTGRGNWTDDIDFDLNGDFSNNTYLNNESFLSFSPALTVLKQEVPSPQEDISTKARKNSHGTLSVLKLAQENKDSVDQSQSAVDNVGSPGAGSRYDNGEGPNTGHIRGFQHVQPSEKTGESNSARNSPHQAADSSVNNEASSDDFKFQYILAAATSIATKSTEETLTYLNQGQSYEIKLKKTGDLSFYRDKILKSVIKICFHERRLQYMEREQMQQWQTNRPGERIIEADVPLSYGLLHVSQPQAVNPNYLNTVEVLWDPMKEVGVYIKVNCISTEFTPKKHGGEKGVPFRIQIETYIENINTTNNNGGDSGGPVTTNLPSPSGAGAGASANSNAISNVANKQPIHAAACQIKVFKLKGADRKHKQDREKIQRRPPSEQEKYQPSFECTILNDIPIEAITSAAGCYSPEYMKLWPNSPVHIPKYDGMPYSSGSTTSNSSPIAINSVTSTNTPALKIMDTNMGVPQQLDTDDYSSNISKDSTPGQVSQWLSHHRLNAYIATFSQFSGSDILRMSKEDLIQICGLADGIRMFNILHAKAIAPRLTLYISFDCNNYHAVYLTSNSIKELTHKIFKLPGFYELSANISNMNGSVEASGYSGWGMQSKYSGSGSNIYSDTSKLFITGPSGVHVLVTDEVLSNQMKDNSLYALEVQNGKVLMKSINKSEN